MFTEDSEALANAEKASSIETGEYEADITGVSKLEARGEGKFAQLILTFTIADGDYEGCEYPFFLTLSPRAVGVRAGFYKAIRYVRPEDGQIDENDFIGCSAKISLKNENGVLRIMKIFPSERETATEVDDSEPSAF